MDFVELGDGGVDVVCAGLSDGRSGLMTLYDIGGRSSDGLVFLVFCPYWRESLRKQEK